MKALYIINISYIYISYLIYPACFTSLRRSLDYSSHPGNSDRVGGFEVKGGKHLAEIRGRNRGKGMFDG